jgi:hypothetical protein
MSGSIALHPKLGLNPHMTVCPRCGKDGPEILLLGIVNSIYFCRGCDIKFVGHKCPKCGTTCGLEKVRALEESERLRGSVCDSCREKQASAAAAVEDGGVYWRCADCKSEGAIRKNDFTERVRLVHGKGTRYEGPCGVEFTRKDCPACGPDKEVERGQ